MSYADSRGFWLVGPVSPEAVIEEIGRLVGPVSPEFARSLRELDFEAMVAILWSRRPGLEDDALAIQVPCLFYAGDADEPPHQYGKDTAARISGARFLTLPGLNHMTASDAADRIVPEVVSFIGQLDSGVSDPQVV